MNGVRGDKLLDGGEGLPRGGPMDGGGGGGVLGEGGRGEDEEKEEVDGDGGDEAWVEEETDQDGLQR
jgi:hypothetical protein